LSFGQVIELMVSNAGMMEEHVPTIRALNETEALVMNQLLNRTRRHTRHSLKHETTKRAMKDPHGNSIAKQKHAFPQTPARRRTL
jgi:hypothetical protein